MILAGPHAYPSLHPVIANVFEKPFITIVLSFIPGNSAIEQCLFPYVSSAYISSDITNISFSIITGTIFASSSLVIIAPVGLLGNGSTSTLVLSVIALKSASLVSLNSSSSLSSNVTGTASAITAQGRYDT